MTEKNTIATYNMVDHATGLAEFVLDQSADISTFGRNVIYVRDQDGNAITMARFEAETLTDGSIVHNLILTVAK